MRKRLRVDKQGPAYPVMPALAKHRRRAESAGGVMQMDREFRQQYGAAVEGAIRALQRRELLGTIRPAGATPRCASGSFANTAEGIESAVKARQVRIATTLMRRDREGRSDKMVQALYNEAMAAKRKLASPRVNHSIPGETANVDAGEAPA